MDPSQEQFPIHTLELGDIADPSQIRGLGGEIAFQQIRGRNSLAFAASPFLAAVSIDQSDFGHDPLDALARHSGAVAS